MNINKAILYGNLTRDPELKALPSGQNVASFSIATNRAYKDKNGQKQEQTEFHNVVAFGKQAELIAQYCHKGSPLYIEGRLQTRSWESEGQKKYRTEVVVEHFQFGARSTLKDEVREEEIAEATPAAGEIKYPEEEIDPADIPF